MVCPECGGEVEKVRAEDGGAIEETVFSAGGLRRKARPATFYACTACDFCSETKPDEREREKGDDDGQEYGDPRDYRDGLE